MSHRKLVNFMHSKMEIWNEEGHFKRYSLHAISCTMQKYGYIMNFTVSILEIQRKLAQHSFGEDLLPNHDSMVLATLPLSCTISLNKWPISLCSDFQLGNFLSSPLESFKDLALINTTQAWERGLSKSNILILYNCTHVLLHI